MEKSDRCDELQELIETLFLLREELSSKDIREDLDDIIEKYNDEYERLDKELAEEEKENLDYLNKEYMRDAI